MMPASEGLTYLKNIITEEHKIPKYQRNYAWGEKQATDLWNDILEYKKNKTNDSKYIFGQIIVYHSSDNNDYVIDGQQRLTTSYLLIAAERVLINKICNGEQKDDRIEDIIHEMKRNVLIIDLSGDNRPYLTPSSNNKAEFEQIINRNSSDPILLNSETNMAQVYNTLIRLIYCHLVDEKYSSNIQIDEDKIAGRKELINEIVDCNSCFLDFQVVYLRTLRLVDAHRIFDTVNTRGMKLTPTDLVKNHIFATCYSNDYELSQDGISLEKDWNDIAYSLGSDFDKVLRYTFIVKFGMVREEDLVSCSKRIIQPAEVKQFLVELRQTAQVFHCLTKKHPLFKDEETMRIIRGIRDSKTSMIMHTPIIASVFIKQFGTDQLESDIKKSLKH